MVEKPSCDTDNEEKFAELELSVLHLQSNVAISETNLAVHPFIQRVVE